MNWRALYDSARSTDQPLQRLALFQEGVRLAEEAGNEDWLFIFRMDVGVCSLEAGQPELGIASFTWCLHTFDHNPNLSYQLQWILRRYSWFIYHTQNYPQITHSQQDALLDDFKKRLSQSGYTLKKYWEIRSILSGYMGQLNEAREYRLLARELPHDTICSDPPTEVNCMVYVYYLMQDWEATLKEAEPILNGTLKSPTVPQYTCPMLAKAFAKLGNRERALEYAQLGVSLIEGHFEHIGVTSELMESFALLDNLPAGINLLERKIGWLKLRNPFEKFQFYSSAMLVLKPALVTNPDLLLRLPESFIADNELQDGRADTILAYFTTNATKLGKAFNQRNGNTYWTDYYGL